MPGDGAQATDTVAVAKSLSESSPVAAMPSHRTVIEVSGAAGRSDAEENGMGWRRGAAQDLQHPTPIRHRLPLLWPRHNPETVPVRRAQELLLDCSGREATESGMVSSAEGHAEPRACGAEQV